MARITPEEALARIQQPSKVKAVKGKTNKVKPLELIETISNSKDNIYIFGNENGSIITPADDSLSPILGTWEGNIEDMPPALENMLDEYAREVEWWQNGGEKISENTADSEPRQTIPVLLETKWSQKSPYNDKLYINNNKCVTGCNTTAVAQIIYYWGSKGFHRGCPKTEKYVTVRNGWTVPALPALITFDYKHLVKVPKTNEEKNAVQQLMEYVGKLFKSDFAPNSTGAAPKKVASYLSKSLKFGKNITYIYASSGMDKFDQKIYDDLTKGRPVIIAGWTGNGGGHTFVADGYDANTDMYHINWGWGGSYNGYFKISALNPTSSVGYNSTKEAIVGIEPEYKLGDVNRDGDVNIVDVTTAVNYILSGKYDEAADINNDGQVTTTDTQLIVNKILGLI